MGHRTTERELKQLIGFLNRRCGYPEEPYSQDESGKFHPNANVYHLDIAYGGYRLSQMSSTEGCTGTSDISPRLTKGELARWIRAYTEGVQIGQQTEREG